MPVQTSDEIKKMTFEEMIEAGLDQLVDACELSVPMESREAVDFDIIYGRAIMHFLRGEQEQLASLITSLDRLSAHPEHDFIVAACKLREQIRARKFDPTLLVRANELVLRETRWQGELSMLLATAFTISDDYQSAMASYSRAVTAFEKQGVIRKALRARMNVLVCESNLHPTRNLFARYHDLYRRAIRKQSRDLIVATTCLLNISREYQRAGAYLVALKYCNRALSLFELQMGELNYFLTLAHRAHLLCDLGRRAEARIDFEAAQVGQFKEVEAALRVIEPMLSGHAPATNADQSDLLPTWRERAQTALTPNEEQPRLSTLEEKLIRYLSDGPRDRIDILEEIYGSALEFETKLNRFKSLLGTLRKKFPQLVLCEDGKYRLADEILVPGLHGPGLKKQEEARSNQTGGLRSR
jgi:tetratricopeptide (TPR) repeat protein